MIRYSILIALFFMGGLYWLTLAEIGPTKATLLFLVLAILVRIFYRRIERIINLTRYGRQKENLYVRSRYPKDRHLVRRKTYHEKWLALAENNLKVQVLLIPFQDHNHPNESWEEYEERFVLEVQQDRVLRHRWLYEKEGEDWYLHHMLNQEGIILE